MYFMDIIYIKFPFWQVFGPPFLASYCGYSAGTIRVLICWNRVLIWVDIRRKRRQFFPYRLHFYTSHWRERGFESRQVHKISTRIIVIPHNLPAKQPAFSFNSMHNRDYRSFFCCSLGVRNWGITICSAFNISKLERCDYCYPTGRNNPGHKWC